MFWSLELNGRASQLPGGTAGWKIMLLFVELLVSYYRRLLSLVLRWKGTFCTYFIRIYRSC